MNAVEIDQLSHSYGSRIVLDALSLRVAAGEVFGLLGPNGSGKTTLFRILSTLIPPPAGRVRVFGRDPSTQLDAVRRLLGVVFQSPSLDRQLTARENLVHQGHLYGMSGRPLKDRVDEALADFGLSDRAGERVETFSGGMRRRVDVAKALLHQPRLLLLDEPSTGLDPAARIDLWRLLREASRRRGVTVLLTTHLMDEADRCERLGVMAAGKLLAADTPNALKSRIGGDVICLTGTDTQALQSLLRRQFGVEADLLDGTVRFERPDGHTFIPRLIDAAPKLVDSVSVGRPTLEDVFIRLTGARLTGARLTGARLTGARLTGSDEPNGSAESGQKRTA